MFGCVILRAATLLVCLLIAASTFSAEQTQRPDSYRYGGVTLDQWRKRVIDFDAQGPQAGASVAPLMEILADEQVDAVTRRNAALALGSIRGPARSVTPQLIKMTLAGDEASAWAAKALSLMGPAARDATDELSRIARDEDQDRMLRLLSLEALGQIGGAHPQAVPALVSVVTDAEDPALRKLAIEALGIAGRDAAIAGPMLVRILRNPREEDEIRRQSTITLGKLGDQAAIAVGPLAETLVFDESEAVRDAAALSLATLGPRGQAMLLRFLKHEDSNLRWRAAMALGDIEGQTGDVQAALMSALEDADLHVQLRAAQSLVKLKTDLADVIPTILRLMQSDDRMTRIDAVELLVSLGDDAKVAMPSLEEMADSESDDVRRTAKLAIKRLTATPVRE